MRRAQDAAVRSKPGYDYGATAEMPQKDIERSLVEGRVHRLQNAIVVFVRLDLLHKFLSWASGSQAVGQQFRSV
jgi:hypothetical protein